MLKVGDIVIMNDKYDVPEEYRDKNFVVKIEAEEICGTDVVWLEGFNGCYPVDGLTKVSNN